MSGSDSCLPLCRVFMGYALCTCMHYVMVWMQAIHEPASASASALGIILFPISQNEMAIPSWNLVYMCININHHVICNNT